MKPFIFVPWLGIFSSSIPGGCAASRGGSACAAASEGASRSAASTQARRVVGFGIGGASEGRRSPNLFGGGAGAAVLEKCRWDRKRCHPSRAAVTYVRER